MKNFAIVLYSVLFTNVMCCRRTISDKELGYEFYKLNRTNHFDGLYNIMLDSRFDSYYDDKTKQNILLFDHLFVYDRNSNKYLYLPIFQVNSSLVEKKRSFQRCNSETREFLFKELKGTKPELLPVLYNKYIDSLLLMYSTIKTPVFHNNKNVRIIGNPSLGNFIEFELNNKVSCFYLKDRSGLTTYWAAFFNRGRKLDEHWYYNINK
jgi:hypothetical protein